MTVGKTISSISKEELFKIYKQGNLLKAVFPYINCLPCKINSPFRKDDNPSFSIFIGQKGDICFKDFGDSSVKGDLIDLLCKVWNCSYQQALDKAYILMRNTEKALPGIRTTNSYKSSGKASQFVFDLQVKTRQWKDYDFEYWKSYGISPKWLKYAEVYPISYKIVTKTDYDSKKTSKYIFLADKYAYCFVERKEGKVTLKVYQPFNTKGFKWSNKHDRSVISLWTKVPKKGKRICICSSLKDALCLWANTGIPAVSVQGEGYSMSETAVNELKKRFEKIYVLFDNDEPGLKDGEKLSHETGFINVVLPPFEGGKDISDYYKIKGKEAFVELIHHLIKSIDYGNKKT